MVFSIWKLTGWIKHWMLSPQNANRNVYLVHCLQRVQTVKQLSVNMKLLVWWKPLMTATFKVSLRYLNPNSHGLVKVLIESFFFCIFSYGEHFSHIFKWRVTIWPNWRSTLESILPFTQEPKINLKKSKPKLWMSWNNFLRKKSLASEKILLSCLFMHCHLWRIHLLIPYSKNYFGTCGPWNWETR